MKFFDAIGTFLSLVRFTIDIHEKFSDVFFVFLETKEEEASKVVSDGPVPWCKSDQLTFISEQVSHHPPSKSQL